MKKIAKLICLSMVLVMLLSAFVSCSGEVSDTDMPQTDSDTEADNEREEILVDKYTEITKIPYKALGRTQLLSGALSADWSAAGFAFEATCHGDVSINMTVGGTRKFTVVVDGIEYKDVVMKSGDNVIATGLEYGKHSFSIMNQEGYYVTVDINGVTLCGQYEEAPQDSKLLIEFIGDSIAHGSGLGSVDHSAGIQDGTLTYAFLAAKELGADYTIVANGGMGVKWGTDYDGANVNRSMKKYPYLNDKERYNILYKGYTRSADLVVIGLNTNDNYRFKLQYESDRLEFRASKTTATEADITTHMDEWLAQNVNATEEQKNTEILKYKASKMSCNWSEVDAHSKAFIASKMDELGLELERLVFEIEKNHGKDVPIIFVRGMMEVDDWLYLTAVDYMTSLIEDEWQGKYEDHVIKVARLTPDRTGYANHPTREGAAIQGAELAAFIKAEFPELIPASE